ncbi:MAG: hypothetical protein V3T59_07720, partial [Desulfobacterales bacterium]
MKKRNLRKLALLLPSLVIVLVFLLSGRTNGDNQAAKLRFGISFTKEQSRVPLDGRVLLMVSSDPSREPRFQISDSPNTQLIFGMDVDRLKPGEIAVVDRSFFGYPLPSISEIPAGEYWIQALFHRYETFHRADGHIVKLPMDRGEGQRWNRAPGNLYSIPQKLRIDPQKDEMINITLDEKIPPIPEPKDRKYIKHVKIKSKLLTEFWGVPMHLGAFVLLPEGFDEHPEARYPLVINHGHFPSTFSGFRE